jgi:hypothetical protein
VAVAQELGGHSPDVPGRVVEAQSEARERPSPGLRPHEREGELDDLDVFVVERAEKRVFACRSEVRRGACARKLAQRFDSRASQRGIRMRDQWESCSDGARCVGVAKGPKGGGRKHGIAGVGHQVGERFGTS